MRINDCLQEAFDFCNRYHNKIIELELFKKIYEDSRTRAKSFGEFAELCQFLYKDVDILYDKLKLLKILYFVFCKLFIL